MSARDFSAWPWRERVIWRVFDAAGIKEGQILPRWARALLWIAHPIERAKLVCAGLVFDDRDCVTICGAEMSASWLMSLGKMPTPSRWFRFIRTAHGAIALQAGDDIIEDAWVAGYYAAGYTHDSEFARSEARKYAAGATE